MGADITVLIVDWRHLENIPELERESALMEAADPDDDDGPVEDGWAWLPPAPEGFPAWCGRYEFGGTLGSYKPHFWAGERWNAMREHVPDDLRTALDDFLAGLIWDLPGTDPGEDGAEPWHGALWTYCPPPDVPALAQAWDTVVPRLEELRGPFTTHVTADPGEWVERFEELTKLLHGWGEAVTQAHHRGWGLVGLPI